MTNRHVAAIFARGLGSRSLGFKPNSRAGIDFLRERDRPDGTMFDVGRIVMIHPYWDMALLELKNAPGGLKPLNSVACGRFGSRRT